VALAEHAWLNDDPMTAIQEAEFALALAREVAHPWFIGELAFRLRLAGREVQTEGAAEPWALLLGGHWQRAAAAWEALGCPYERAEALALGDEAAMRSALFLFDGLGASRRARLLRRTMRARGLSVPVGPRSATRANRAGLTARQMDVLRLVADGQTNEEIGEHLGLSAKTVDHHVSAILHKLDVERRRDAARAARLLGLLDASS
jgi:DNA-binding CsgD family transcriptional regulator